MKLRLLGKKKNENRGKKNRMETEMSRKKAKKKGRNAEDAMKICPEFNIETKLTCSNQTFIDF